MDDAKPRRRWRLPLFATALLAAAGGLGWLALPYVWLPTGTSTVSLWYAEDTFQLCSRDAPEGGAPYWLPTGQQIFDLEKNLWYRMEQRDATGQKAPRRFQQYHRQYTGFTRHGVRLIYLNAALDDNFGLDGWTLFNKPVQFCDGGNLFWGMVYNPATGAYEEPQFNGPG